MTAECGLPAGEGAKEELATVKGLPSPTIAEIVELQRQRVFCIKSQSRCDRSTESFIARYLGFRADAPEADRAAIFKQAAALRRAVEKGGEGQSSIASLSAGALAACSPIAILSAQSREAWDKHRLQVEKRMRVLARSLPAWPFVEKVSGFGDLGLAIIVGEAGDLANYATKERLWKRLGLAVIDGMRQGNPGKAATAADWIAHGYNRGRRAQVWSMVSDAMFRHQWRGEKDGVGAHAIGPYGEIYAKRKAHTANREGWTPAHREADARRIMSKALVENLWRAWRQATAREALA